MESAFRFRDGLGPAKVFHITETHSDLKAVLMVDNVACGPAIGGTMGQGLLERPESVPRVPLEGSDGSKPILGAQ